MMRGAVMAEPGRPLELRELSGRHLDQVSTAVEPLADGMVSRSVVPPAGDVSE